MFDFRKISFEDKEWITKCLAVSDFRGAEYCFANNMAWQRLNDTVITHHGDFYISCSFEDGQPYFTFPAGVKIDVEGKEKYIRLFDELKEYVSAQGKPLIVSSVTDDNLSWIKEYYGDKSSASMIGTVQTIFTMLPTLSSLKAKSITASVTT